MSTITDIITKPAGSIAEAFETTSHERNDRNWIQTYTGRQFWPLDPRPEEIDIRDIAHALAMKCRYTGHTNLFYSVAQHSVIASQHVPPEDAFWALMHDATEAYLPDVARPVKRAIGGFIEIEDRLMACIAGKFGLSLPMPPSIKEIDLRMLATERRDLMKEPPRAWVSTERVLPLEDHIAAWDWLHAEWAWLSRFYEVAPTRVQDQVQADATAWDALSSARRWAGRSA